MQTKRLALSALELKFAGEDMTFSGYASVFGGVDSYGDTIAPQAYDKTIDLESRERPVRMRWNHYGPVIGKWTSLHVDDKGLFVQGQLTPGHSTAVDVYASLKHGSIDGMSIGYMPIRSKQLSDNRRLLEEIELIEISVVEEPADLGARVDSIKSALEHCNSLKEIESLLRDAAGYSKTDATALVSRIRSLTLGDQAAVSKAQKDELLSAYQRLNLNLTPYLQGIHHGT
jgi:HK97 family phage prohead protease